MVKRSTNMKPNNPWRKLERDDYVIAAAVKGTARCAACQSKIKKGEIQVGPAGLVGLFPYYPHAI